MDPRPVGYFGLLLIGLIFLFALTGCTQFGLSATHFGHVAKQSANPASNRYFSEEEDRKAREVCEPAGCVIVPAPQMLELLQRLQGQAI